MIGSSNDLPCISFNNHSAHSIVDLIGVRNLSSSYFRSSKIKILANFLLLAFFDCFYRVIQIGTHQSAIRNPVTRCSFCTLREVRFMVFIILSYLPLLAFMRLFCFFTITTTSSRHMRAFTLFSRQVQ